MAARANLHLGQAVRFVDFRDGQMRSGKIIAFKDTQATVLEQGTKRTWKIPCVSMHGYTEAERAAEQAAYEPPPEPATAKTPAREFQRGDTVTFDDRDGRGITGVIVRVNQRTATIGTGTGGTWRVPFHMLRHVLDVRVALNSACAQRQEGLGAALTMDLLKEQKKAAMKIAA